MKALKFVLVLFVIFVFCFSTFAEQVRVLMKDGKILEGELVGLTETAVYLKDKDGKVSELSVTDVKEVFNAKTHKPIPFKKPTGEVIKPTPPTPAPQPKPTPQPTKKKEKNLLNYELILELGSPLDNTIKNEVWPLFIADHPKTPWNGMDMMFNLYFNIMVRVYKDWEVGLFFGGNFLGMGSENSGVDITGYDIILGYYTIKLEYDLPVKALQYGLKVRMDLFEEPKSKMKLYSYFAIGQIAYTSNWRITYTSSFFSGSRSGTFSGDTMFSRIGGGMILENIFVDLGFQFAKIKEIKVYHDYDSLYPEMEGVSYPLTDSSGKKVPADFSCVFLTVGYKFWLF